VLILNVELESTRGVLEEMVVVAHGVELDKEVVSMMVSVS